MKFEISRTIAAGLVGGLALNLTLLLTFRLSGFGLNGTGILLDPSLQSQKLIAVWTQLEPLPLIFSNPAPMVIGFILFGLGHAFVYRTVSPAWPNQLYARAWRFAVLIFFLSFLFFEFFTPFNLFGEPLVLIGLQLTFWLITAVAEAFAIAAVFER